MSRDQRKYKEQDKQKKIRWKCPTCKAELKFNYGCLTCPNGHGNYAISDFLK